jgi:uncharacterized protein (TIGR02145 family)
MVLRFFIFAAAFLISCTSEERDSVCDEKSIYYNGCVGGVLPSSSSEPSGGGKGNDIATYKTIGIGTQTWMAENYNYVVAGSKCGGADGKLTDNNTGYCNSYGRLYNWVTAMALPEECNFTSCASQIKAKHRGICPKDWHIPSIDEWRMLTDVVGTSTAATKLKAQKNWLYDGNGTDDFNFAALPGGYGYNGSFFDFSMKGSWWSASEDRSDYAHAIIMNYDDEYVIEWSPNKDTYLYSVRCVKD